MSDRVGGDLAEMDQMASSFRQQATAVTDVKRALDQQAAKIPEAWKGPNADKFKSAWDAYKSSFDKVSQALEEAQDGIRKNRQAIATATGH
ncbi:WXG100 family type VII secretion target [Nonomuraea sp. NPDC046802]|uniref:WXG100 family type VII secretion target n=1 Tax=Nonomuraea sp. NPDC046802 TaxID=3154919 RepID=UPI0033E38840